MNKKLFFISAALTILMTGASPVVAQTASDSSLSPAASNSADTNQRLLERIHNAIQQHTDQIKGVISELGQKKRGFIGQIQRITQTQVTIQNPKEQEILTIAAGVDLQRDGKKVTIDDLVVGDWVIAEGYQDQNFTLKRLLVFSHSIAPHTFTTQIGAVRSVTKTGLVILPRGTQTPVTFSLTKTTPIQDYAGNTLTQKNIQTDTQYLVISYLDDKNQPVVSLVRSLAPPPDMQQTASPSAKRRLTQ